MTTLNKGLYERSLYDQQHGFESLSLETKNETKTKNKTPEPQERRKLHIQLRTPGPPCRRQDVWNLPFLVSNTTLGKTLNTYLFRQLVLVKKPIKDFCRIELAVPMHKSFSFSLF